MSISRGCLELMAGKTHRWKGLEKAVPALMQKYKIPAFRHEQRQNNYAISIDDVGITGFPWIKIDCKYRVNGFQTNTLLSVVEDKYCKEATDVAVLVTKGFQERGQRVTIDDEFFCVLLGYFLGVGTKEELWSIYNGK